MRRRPILMTTGLILVAFALGVGVGSRFRQRPVVYEDAPVAQQPAGASSVEQGQGPTAPSSQQIASLATAPGASPPPCIDIRNAAPLVGKRGCISGLVLKVYTARSGNTFLDFCQDYRACPFTSVVFSADKSSFGDLSALQGKRVEIRGDVVSYHGRAEIIIHDAHQIRSGP